MQIKRRIKHCITQGILFLMIAGTSLVVSGCDKVGKLEKFEIPNKEPLAESSYVKPKPIVPMQKTLDKLKSKKVYEQEEALQEIEDWLNDGIFNVKDIKARQTLLEYIASNAPLFLRGKAVGMLMSSGDDKVTGSGGAQTLRGSTVVMGYVNSKIPGDTAQKALEKQLGDNKKAPKTLQAMVESLSRSDVSEPHKKQLYDLCLKSSDGRKLLAKALVSSNKEHSQAVKQLMEKEKGLLSSEMQDAIGEQLLEVVKNPDWSPDVSYVREVVKFLKTKLAFEKYVKFMLYLAWSSSKEIRNLLAIDAFTKKNELHKHAKLVVEALTQTIVGSLAAKAIVAMVDKLGDLLLIGEVLLDNEARQRVDKTGIALADPLVAHVSGLIDEITASVLLVRTLAFPPGVGDPWGNDINDNSRNQARDKLGEHLSHLQLQEIKDAFASKLGELTHFPAPERIFFTALPGIVAPMPFGNPPSKVFDYRIAAERLILLEMHQRKFQQIVLVLRQLGNAQLNQYLRNQAAQIRRGRFAAELPLGWNLP